MNTQTAENLPANIEYVNKVRMALKRLFSKAGLANSHAPPDGATDQDKDLHRLWVLSEGRRYFNDEYELFKTNVIDAYALQGAIIEAEPGFNGAILYTNCYELLLSKQHGSKQVDSKKLVQSLQALSRRRDDAGLTAEINAIIEGCTKERVGSKRYTVAYRG